MVAENSLTKFRGASQYILDNELAEIVNISMALELPLLLKGEPGTGKTMLAHAIAEAIQMRLIVLKWYLRDVTNAILDQAVHVDGISRDDALKLLIEDAFQEEREAAAKWVRAQLTSAQLSPTSSAIWNTWTCAKKPKRSGVAGSI